jgi:hypothetical protein
VASGLQGWGWFLEAIVEVDGLPIVGIGAAEVAAKAIVANTDHPT